MRQEEPDKERGGEGEVAQQARYPKPLWERSRLSPFVGHNVSQALKNAFLPVIG